MPSRENDPIRHVLDARPGPPSGVEHLARDTRARMLELRDRLVASRDAADDEAVQRAYEAMLAEVEGNIADGGRTHT